MRNIYDLMEYSDITDLDGNNYPDPLSLDLSNIKFSTSLQFQNVLRPIYKRPYMCTAFFYYIDDLNDLLLWMNGIEYDIDSKITKLQLPSLKDLISIYDKYRKNK